MGIEPTGPAVHEAQPALKAGRHTSTDPLPSFVRSRRCYLRVAEARGKGPKKPREFPEEDSAFRQGQQSSRTPVVELRGQPAGEPAHDAFAVFPRDEAAAERDAVRSRVEVGR